MTHPVEVALLICLGLFLAQGVAIVSVLLMILREIQNNHDCDADWKAHHGSTE